MAPFPPDTELEKHIHGQCANIRVLLRKKDVKFLLHCFKFGTSHSVTSQSPAHKWDNSGVTYSRRPGFLILHSTLDPTISVYTQDFLQTMTM